MGKWKTVGIIAGIAAAIVGLVEVASRGVSASTEAVAQAVVQDTGSVYDTRTHILTLSVQFWKTVPRPPQNQAKLTDTYQNTLFQYSIDNGLNWISAKTNNYGQFQLSVVVPSVIAEVWYKIAGVEAHQKIYVTYK